MTAARTPQVGETWTALMHPERSRTLLHKDGDCWFAKDETGFYTVIREASLTAGFDPPALFPQIPDEFWLRVGVSGPFENHAWDAPDIDVDISDANHHAGWVKVRVVERRERER